MRILADENIAGETVRELRGRGHDVFWAAADAPGAPDDELLARATAEKRVILTFDKDFGELAFRDNIPAPEGVILLRVDGSSPAAVTAIVIAALESREDWPGHFSVIENARIRMTPLGVPD